MVESGMSGLAIGEGQEIPLIIACGFAISESMAIGHGGAHDG